MISDSLLEYVTDFFVIFYQYFERFNLPYYVELLGFDASLNTEYIWLLSVVCTFACTLLPFYIAYKFLSWFID